MNIYKQMIRNLSATIGQIAEKITKSIATQQTSLNSLAQVIIDTRVALDFLLAKQGVICAIAQTICCTFNQYPWRGWDMPRKTFAKGAMGYKM